MEIPKIKKKINAFLVGEDGKISKSKIISVGAMLAGVVAIISSESDMVIGQTHETHTNSVNMNGMSMSHTHHGNHASHGSHSSHGSHGSHGSHTSW